jgi:excinuclease ABC subunit A
VPQIEERLKFLAQVGLAYLALERPTETLSGGEAQRIRLAAQLGSNLSGVSSTCWTSRASACIARDNEPPDRHARTHCAKRATRCSWSSTTRNVMDARRSRMIDLGPGAGRHGGELLAAGTPANRRKIKASARSLTGLYLDKGIPPLRGKYREVTSDRCQGSKVGRTVPVSRNSPRHPRPPPENRQSAIPPAPNPHSVIRTPQSSSRSPGWNFRRRETSAT